MAYNKLTLSANTTGTLLTNVNHANRVNQTYQALITFTGTFGSGTVSLAVSPDSGVTLIVLKDKLGNSISFASNAYANIELGGYTNKNNLPLQIYAVLTGATSPSLNITSFDNMG